MMMALSDQTRGKRVVIGISRPLNRVVTGTTVIIMTVIDQTGEAVVTTTAATTTTLATTAGTEDIWDWCIDTPVFTVKSARKHIDNYFLPVRDFATRWNRYLPKKINIFIWRSLRDRLPTRWNLSRRGIDIESISCPICDSGIETLYHTLWTCSLATTIWNCALMWLDLPTPSLPNIQAFYAWLDDLHMTSNKKAVLDVICGVILWSLWKHRNESIFSTTSPKRSLLFDKIVECSFRWYSSRNKLSSISWNNWIRNPLEDYSL
nr:RNA-directed DNA polymerase, eukaryota [Tanacetum cinerariifolium]